MPFGDVDAAFRRILAEALKPLEEQVRSLQEELGKSGHSAAAEYLTIKDASGFASVAPGTLRRWIRNGHIASYKAGRSVRVKRSDLEEFMTRVYPEGEEVIDFAARAAKILGGA